MAKKKFKTLTDWNTFMKGRNVLIINRNHGWYGEECSFVEMVAPKEVLNENNPKDIKMKVKTNTGWELLLDGGEFMIIEKKTLQNPKFN